MALKRILGTAVRHPIATTALVAGVAKGAAGVLSRGARGKPTAAPTTPAAPVETAAAPVVPETVEEVVQTAADGHELPEPVVYYAADEPEPTPEIDLHEEDELVWTSESAPQSSD